jgi:hypothetical protein
MTRSKFEISLDALAYVNEMLINWSKLSCLESFERDSSEKERGMITDIYVNLVQLKNLYEEENEKDLNEPDSA